MLNSAVHCGFQDSKRNTLKQKLLVDDDHYGRSLVWRTEYFGNELDIAYINLVSFGSHPEFEHLY